MQCVIQNKTQFLIVHDPPAYFNSGRYDDPPKNVEPYDNMVFTVCNRDAAFTGATGGAAFRIILDGVAEYPFALVCAHQSQSSDLEIDTAFESARAGRMLSLGRLLPV